MVKDFVKKYKGRIYYVHIRRNSISITPPNSEVLHSLKGQVKSTVPPVDPILPDPHEELILPTEFQIKKSSVWFLDILLLATIVGIVYFIGKIIEV